MDTPNYKDPFGYECADWEGACGKSWGYSSDEYAETIKNCCGTCSKEYEARKEKLGTSIHKRNENTLVEVDRLPRFYLRSPLKNKKKERR